MADKRQGSLFNPPPRLNIEAARAARDAGIAQVESAATDGFKADAAAAIYRSAQDHHEFIVDEVWKAMPDAPRTGDNRAMGAAMLAAKKAGWIEPTGRWVSSAQTQCHANPRQVWRSLLKAS
jgi:hypothetical protein